MPQVKQITQLRAQPTLGSGTLCFCLTAHSWLECPLPAKGEAPTEKTGTQRGSWTTQQPEKPEAFLWEAVSSHPSPSSALDKPQAPICPCVVPRDNFRAGPVSQDPRQLGH